MSKDLPPETEARIIKTFWAMASRPAVVEFGKGDVSLVVGHVHRPKDIDPLPCVSIGSFIGDTHTHGERVPTDTLAEEHLRMIFPTQEQADAVRDALLWKDPQQASAPVEPAEGT